MPTDDAPQSSWEWEQRFPQLALFFGANFYPHCLDCYSSQDEILGECLGGLDHADIQQALAEIADLRIVADLTTPMPEAFTALGMGVYPPEGMSWTDALPPRKCPQRPGV